MTKLPESMEEETIENMLPGDKGFTVPWAMCANENRDLYINKRYNVYPQANGTVHMYIERTETGVIVYKRTIEKDKYSLGSGWSIEVGLPVEALK